MARIRKAGRLWDEEARTTAARVMVDQRGPFFTIDVHCLFERDAPLELEIGAGRGDFIIERAEALPERNFLAVELSAKIAQLMAIRAARRALTNLRVVRMDARSLVNLMLPDHCLAACHIYFPDPWPKSRHTKHRLLTDRFIVALARKLAPGAPLFFATDVKAYAEKTFSMAEAAGMHHQDIPVPGADGTGFARKFIAAGIAVYARAYFANASIRH
jgi:tRNA (guanine-N(7)-)-methyltransferase